MSGPKVIPLTDMGVKSLRNLCPVDPYSPPPTSFDDVDLGTPEQHVSSYVQPKLDTTFWGGAPEMTP